MNARFHLIALLLLACIGCTLIDRPAAPVGASPEADCRVMGRAIAGGLCALAPATASELECAGLAPESGSAEPAGALRHCTYLLFHYDFSSWPMCSGIM